MEIPTEEPPERSPPIGEPGPSGVGGLPPSAPMASGAPLPEPSEEDIEKYDLGIQDYAAEEDMESQDYSIE